MNLDDLDLKIEQELNYILTDKQRKCFQLENKSVSDLAIKLLNEKENFKIRPLNLAEILKHLNLNAEYKTELDNHILFDFNNKTIYIKKDEVDIKQKLYHIAVAIGNFILNNNSNDLAKEIDANIFAIELLMPYNEFRNKMLLGYTVEHLKEHFNVSYEVAYYRYNSIAKKLD